MGWQKSSKVGRTAKLGVLALTALVVPLLPTDAQATKAAAGGGVVHGTTVFDGSGLPTGACQVGGTGDNVGFTVNGFAPSVVYNTVITGFVGAMRITGRGNSECAQGPTRTGTLNLTVRGTGPTGSQIDCPTMNGSFQRAGTVVVVHVGGECAVNSYGLSEVSFDAGLQFTPYELVEDPETGTTNIKRAFFDGAFALSPVIT